jgi:hypothetical protein
MVMGHFFEQVGNKVEVFNLIGWWMKRKKRMSDKRKARMFLGCVYGKD